MPYNAADNRYDTIEYKRVGKSGLQLPGVSLGLWNNFGTDRPLDNQRAILRRAFDLGINHFDLANNYGPPAGSAESNFGAIYASDFLPYRDELTLPPPPNHRLTRVGGDYVDIFDPPRPDPETPIEETMGALATAVQSGRALYAGVSNYNPEETLAAAAALAEHKIPLTIHQPRYNMFDRHIENGLFPVLDQIGAGSIVFSPLAQGLLTDRYIDGTIPPDSRVAEGRWLDSTTITEDYLARVRALNHIANDRGQSLAQLALTWVLRHPQVTPAPIGAASVAQLENNLGTLAKPALTAEEIAAIEPFAVDGTDI